MPDAAARLDRAYRCSYVCQACGISGFLVKFGVSARCFGKRFGPVTSGLPRCRLWPPLAAPPGRSSSLRCGRSTWTCAGIYCPGGAWRERDGDDLPALAGDHQGAVPALDAERLDVGFRGFGDAQPVEGQQGDQRVLCGRAEPGGDQERAELVAVRAGGVGFVVQAGPAEWAAGE